MKKLIALLLLIYSAGCFAQYPPERSMPENYPALRVGDSLNVPFIANGTDTIIPIVNSTTGKIDSVSLDVFLNTLGGNYDLQYVTDQGAATSNKISYTTSQAPFSDLEIPDAGSVRSDIGDSLAAYELFQKTDTTITVCETGGCDYSTFQSAFDFASTWLPRYDSTGSPNTVKMVLSGTFTEGMIATGIDWRYVSITSNDNDVFFDFAQTSRGLTFFNCSNINFQDLKLNETNNVLEHIHLERCVNVNFSDVDLNGGLRGLAAVTVKSAFWRTGLIENATIEGIATADADLYLRQVDFDNNQIGINASRSSDVHLRTLSISNSVDHSLKISQGAKVSMAQTVDLRKNGVSPQSSDVNIIDGELYATEVVNNKFGANIPVNVLTSNGIIISHVDSLEYVENYLTYREVIDTTSFTPSDTSNKYNLSFNSQLFIKNPSSYINELLDLELELKNTSTETVAVFFDNNYKQENRPAPVLYVAPNKTRKVVFERSDSIFTTVNNQSELGSIYYAQSDTANRYNHVPRSELINDTVYTVWRSASDHNVTADTLDAGIYFQATDKNGNILINPTLIVSDYSESVVDTIATGPIISDLKDGREIIFWIKRARTTPRWWETWFMIRNVNGTFTTPARVDDPLYVPENNNGWDGPNDFYTNGNQWILAMYGYDEARPPGGDNRANYDAYLIVSTDAGSTWDSLSVVFNGGDDGLDYEEPRLLKMSNGDFIMVVRNDVNGTAYVSYSNGSDTTSWSEPEAKFNTHGRVGIIENSEIPGQLISMGRNSKNGPFQNEYEAFRSIYQISNDYGYTWGSAKALSPIKDKYGYGDWLQLEPNNFLAIWAGEYDGNLNRNAQLYQRWYTQSDFTDRTKYWTRTKENYLYNLSHRIGFGTENPLVKFHFLSTETILQLTSTADGGNSNLDFVNTFDDSGFRLSKSNSEEAFHIRYTNNLAGDGRIGPSTNLGKFWGSGRLEWDSDIQITDGSKGVIFKTPDGTACYRLTIDNSGNLTTTLITCP